MTYGKVRKMDIALAYKYDGPPSQKYLMMVTLITIRNDCKSQGKAMRLHLTPQQLSISFII